MLKICMITPPADVGLTSLFPGRFCLAQVAKEHKEYADYFKGCKDVIMDNGMYEGKPLEWYEYSEVIYQVRPSIVIAPDDFQDTFEASYDKAIQFRDYMLRTATLVPNSYMPDIMWVPQVGRYNDVSFVDFIDFVNGQKDFASIGINKLVAPALFGTPWVGDSMREVLRIALVSKLDTNRKYIHCLGITDTLGALRVYNQLGVESLDSASFYWLPFKGKHIQRDLDWRMIDSEGRPQNFFELEATSEQEHDIVEFAQRVQSFLDGKHSLDGPGHLPYRMRRKLQ